MTENKYHTSINGFLTPCTAKKRTCPRGQHYTQEQYTTMAENNDPKVRITTFKHSPDSYYGQAEAKYVEAVKAEKAFTKVSAATKKFEKKLLKENKMDRNTLYTSKEQSEEALTAALSHARKVYEEEGVDKVKASFIVQDMRMNSNPTRPVTKRKDSRDPDIAEKTKKAVARLKSDPEYQKLAKSYEDSMARHVAANKVFSEVNSYRYEQMRQNKCTGTIERDRAAAEEKLQKAKAWLTAGVTPKAKEQMTNQVKPAMVSIDKTGKINNVWVETKNGIEPIVGYEDNSVSVAGGQSGSFITASGDKIYTVTHYHSYKSEVNGSQRLIVGEKKGSTYPAKFFSVSSEYDSGD